MRYCFRAKQSSGLSDLMILIYGFGYEYFVRVSNIHVTKLCSIQSPCHLTPGIAAEFEPTSPGWHWRSHRTWRETTTTSLNRRKSTICRFHAEIGLVPGWGKARPDVDPRQKATGYRLLSHSSPSRSITYTYVRYGVSHIGALPQALPDTISPVSLPGYKQYVVLPWHTTSRGHVRTYCTICT
ncbi:hypothetical protein N656DRAFT_259560 [Canariomyces notabilis]|uniref:Uncharacterized protein n=1 Tax=Canariomyces notabilis TaxID=2074819 RepID=A0AAN6YXM0_9PEZI|nr:hypothetical protein N656DRAFT_259560 [Canariomyces arenarius]